MSSPKIQEKSEGYAGPGTDEASTSHLRLTRSSDGLTLNKITMLSITVAISVIAYFYVADRDANNSFKISVSASLSKLVESSIIADARNMNMDARLVKQEARLEKLYDESRVYWGYKASTNVNPPR